jgi:hypothetical protein
MSNGFGCSYMQGSCLVILKRRGSTEPLFFIPKKKQIEKISSITLKNRIMQKQIFYSFILVGLMLFLITSCSKTDDISKDDISKTVKLTTAGTLSTSLTSHEKSTVTNLTITGAIDERDFEIMRDSMPALAVLDIKNVTILAYTGFQVSYNDYVNYPANEIPQYAFCTYYGGVNLLKRQIVLTKISLPNSVTSIGINAFDKCTRLTSITIPSSVTSIGPLAFEYSGLTSIIIPSSVTSIGICAFYSCIGLTSITIFPSVTSIGDGVFESCTGLTSVTIPSSVTSIGDDAFEGCIRLTSITIPSSVTSIGYNAFYGCTGLTSITIPSSVTSIGGAAFGTCKGLTSISIPSSVTYIGAGAFEWCTGLTSVIIPLSVTTIEIGAFDGCSGLTSIYANSTLPIALSSSSSVFSNVNKVTCILYVPAGSKSAYQAAKQWKDFTNIVEK